MTIETLKRNRSKRQNKIAPPFKPHRLRSLTSNEKEIHCKQCLKITPLCGNYSTSSPGLSLKKWVAIFLREKAWGRGW